MAGRLGQEGERIETVETAETAEMVEGVEMVEVVERTPVLPGLSKSPVNLVSSRASLTCSVGQMIPVRAMKTGHRYLLDSSRQLEPSNSRRLPQAVSRRLYRYLPFRDRPN